MIAKITNAITPKSFLLSTNTKNAHIQLVNRNSNISHQNESSRLLSFFHGTSSSVDVSGRSFFINHFSTSTIAHNPNVITNNPLMKFMTIAIVSGDNQKKFAIGLISANRKAIKAYHTFHHPIGKTQALLARTLGINM